jgi:hypothetical protein
VTAKYLQDWLPPEFQRECLEAWIQKAELVSGSGTHILRLQDAARFE